MNRFTNPLKTWQWSARLLDWLFLCLVVGILAIIYLSLSMSASDDTLVMPLDDAYIHFQYARQMASGEPYVYNPGEAPSSGATSLLYSPLLAIGYSFGFDGLSLAYPALFIGGLAFLLSAWCIYLTVLHTSSSNRWLALIIALGFMGNGAFIWAAFSGMETMLFVFAVLLTLYAFQSEQFALILSGGMLAALIRPEGAIVAASTALVMMYRMGCRREYRRLKWTLLPFLAILVQPLLNFSLTGELTATGSQSKSHLYNTTIPFAERLELIREYWQRIVEELFTGSNPVDGAYVPGVFAWLALVTVLLAFYPAWRQRDVPPALLAGAWLLAFSLAIALLETAFWHFKRYQLPMMALFFPLTGFLLTAVTRRYSWGRTPLLVAALILTGISTLTTLDFARRYRDNVAVVQNQQVRMALWIRENLPDDARIGVHDAGIIRYVGEHPTYDLVGLTTDEVSLAWRQGSGAIYETMLTHDSRPDYFAIYHDIQSLPFLAEAGIFGEPLEAFTYPLPENTVASATATQIVSRANWPAGEAALPQQTSLAIPDREPVARLNVAHLASESDFNYTWHNDDTPAGFLTEVRRLPCLACDLDGLTDGGRLLTGGEAFDLPAIEPGQDYLIVLRVHAAVTARLEAGCSTPLDYAVVPTIPGHWVEIPFLIPGTESRFCMNVIDTIYHSYHYWIYAVDSWESSPPDAPLHIITDTTQQQKMMLVDAGVKYYGDTLQLNLTLYTDGQWQQDGKLFVHLYTDPTLPPVRQIDTWLADNTLPLANLLPGYHQETVDLDMSGLKAGVYQLAFGFYNPVNGERYLIGSSDRYFLDKVIVDGE